MKQAKRWSKVRHGIGAELRLKDENDAAVGWLQKARKHKYGWAGGVSLGMESMMGGGVS